MNNGNRDLTPMCSILLLSTVLSFNATVGSADLKGKEQLLAGVWVDMPYVAESNCHGLLLLFSDHKFAMEQCRHDLARGLCRKTETIGEWILKGHVLKLAVMKRAVFTSKFTISDDCDGCCYDAKPDVHKFSSPVVESLPCILPAGIPDLSVGYNRHCWEMTLNGKRYWKFNAEIETYCELISLAKEFCKK